MAQPLETNFQVFGKARICFITAVTFATKITVVRLALIPVFCAFALAYGAGVRDGNPSEWLRWTALAIFVTASVSDGIDGWIARRFNQTSDLGAFLDPLADKTLLLTAILILSLVDWGPDGWSLPAWFAAIVVARDCIIVGGLWILRSSGRKVKIAPHIIGKICTVTQMIAIGWVMLRVVPVPPVYPSIVAGIFTVWSALLYLREGTRILRHQPASHP